MDASEKLAAREKMLQRAQEFRQRGDQSGFFETIYEQAAGDGTLIPWVHMAPNPLFLEWAERVDLQGHGKRALQVGCGLGDDAEELARRGFEVTAFDISAKAIAWCQQRFPNSKVDYLVADLFALPETWEHRFDFVLEAITLQALPRPMLGKAIESLTHCVAPDNSLLAIGLGTEQPLESGQIPLPLAHSELAGFERAGLHEDLFEVLHDQEVPHQRRFRVLYRA